MGASTEILVRASNAGLRMKEVGIPISYLRSKSSQNPIFQWFDVIGATFKQTAVKHPLKFYGTPAVGFLALGVSFGVFAVDLYVRTGKLVTNLAIISLTSMIIGLVLGTTAILLFAIS